ncbi:MAG: CidA/LrgA family protein [Clostridiales bacterium]|jgi:holin-like protein|nr:CidA/LrgA family protein [Clostridiales bacterium]
MRILTQIGIVLSVCLIGEGISLLLPFPFPGSIAAMLLLFLLLVTGAVKPRHIREKSDFLLQNMAFFFIPAGVGILDHLDILYRNLLPLLFICVVTTILTFAAAAFTVRGVVALQNRIRGKQTHDR